MRLVLKGLLGGLVNVGVVAFFLLGTAELLLRGGWRWPRALELLLVYGVLLEAAILFLARKAPASLEVRFRRRSRTQPVADRFVILILQLCLFAWLAFLPLDVFRLRLFPPPVPAVSFCGAVLFLAGFAIVMTALYQNAFASPMVEDQTERGQVVVDHGLYALVRHPFYLGAALFLPGMALWLESYAGALGSAVLIAVLVLRIPMEEAALRKALPGYANYMSRVRYRLVPGFW